MRKLALAVLVLALVLVAWFVLREPTTRTAEAPDFPSESPAASSPGDRAAESVLAPAPVADPPRAAVVEPAPSAVAATPTPPDDGLAEVRGRFLLPGGLPANGVELRLRGWAGNQERTLKYGLPEAWDDPATTTGTDGRFALRFDPPRAYQFVLKGWLAGHAAASWRWTDLEPEKVLDVGDVTLAAAGSVRARVIDAEGRVLRKDWLIYAEGGPALGAEADRTPTRVNAAVDPATGWAQLDGLAPGPTIVKAYSRIASWITGPTVVVRAGEVVDADVAYTGPDNSRRIVVLPFVRPFHVFSHDVGPITLRGAGIEVRTAVRIENSSQSFSFEDLDPGRYTAQIDDPRFLPWRADGVEPGTSVDAKLEGNAAVQIAFVDAGGGAIQTRYDLDVRLDGVNFRPNVFRLVDKTKDAPAGGLVKGLVPGDQTVIVRVEGYSPCELAVPALAAYETRALVARLTRGATVSGTVHVRGSDAPQADVGVVLRPHEGEAEGRVRMRSADDASTRSTRTDANGRFAFELVGDGEWTVEATLSPALRARRDVVVADGSAPDASVECPPTGVMSGRVIGPTGADWTGLSIFAMPRKPDNAPDEEWYGIWANWKEIAAPIGADGTFRTPLLPVGVVDVSLSLPELRVPSGFSGWSGSQGGRIALEEHALEPGKTQREYDVRDRFPGGIEVSARVNGEPVAGLVVQAISTEPMSSSGVCVLDAEGRGVMRPVVPATYRITAKPIDGGWWYRDERSVQLAANGTARVLLEIQVVESELLVVDEVTRAPLADALLQIGFAGAEWPEIEARTDGEGRMRRALAVGSYVLWSGGRSAAPAPGPSFEWPARGSAPMTLAIRSDG